MGNAHIDGLGGQVAVGAGKLAVRRARLLVVLLREDGVGLGGVRHAAHEDHGSRGAGGRLLGRLDQLLDVVVDLLDAIDASLRELRTARDELVAHVGLRRRDRGADKRRGPGLHGLARGAAALGGTNSRDADGRANQGTSDAKARRGRGDLGRLSEEALRRLDVGGHARLDGRLGDGDEGQHLERVSCRVSGSRGWMEKAGQVKCP
mmetsp:Transcript_29826/g.88587  ORF Transcript_29826/g.88587 Transcript_29826/m.88587 type:complete len:206 (+) Transcript_29826:941-1558(+)